MRAWLSAFLLTQLVEVPIQARALEGPALRRYGLAFASSSLTHPMLWYVLTAWVRPTWPAILVAEGLVVLVEGAFLHGMGARAGWRWAFVANGASVGVGLVTRALFDWP